MTRARRGIGERCVNCRLYRVRTEPTKNSSGYLWVCSDGVCTLFNTRMYGEEGCDRCEPRKNEK